MIFITGLIRSGTTIVGKLIENASNRHCYYEPCSPRHGIFKNIGWYERFNENQKYEYKNFLEGKGNFKYRKKNNSVKEYLKEKLGGKENLMYQINTKVFNSNPSLIKDPIALFNLDFFLSKNFKIVITTKDVYSFVESMNRVAWDLDIESLKAIALREFPNLLETINTDYRLGRLVFYWSLCINYVSKYNKDVIIIDSQSLKFVPFKVTNELMIKLDLDLPRKKILNKYFYSNENTKKEKTHNLRRKKPEVKKCDIDLNNYYEINRLCNESINLYNRLIRENAFGLY